MNTTLRALVSQAERLVQTEAYQEAIAICHAILRRHPRFARCYRILAEAYLGLGEHSEAADLFRRALGVDPEDPVAYAGLGIVFAERGLREEAIWQLERAFELAPGRDGLRRELARLYQERGSSAEVQLTRAALARLYARGGLWNKAIGELKDLIAREPYRLDLRASLVRTLWRAGQQEEAARAAQTVIDQAPNCLVARLILGAYWCCQGRTDEARPLLLGARELDPEDREATRLMGDTWPWLLQAVSGEPAAAAPAAGEAAAPEEAAEQLARPQAVPGQPALPDWLAAPGATQESTPHIVTLPGASLRALLSSLEEEAAAEGEGELPSGPEAPAPQQPSPPRPRTLRPLTASPAGTPRPEPAPPTQLEAGPLSPVSALQHQLEATPDDHDTRLALARALTREGRLEEALTHYDALAAQGNYLGQVIADLEALVRATPGDRALCDLLGDAYARAGRFQDSMRMYRSPSEHDRSD